jgi:hypothetical protein
LADADLKKIRFDSISGRTYPQKAQVTTEPERTTMAKTRTTYQRWSVKCNANKILTAGLTNGTIYNSMKPKQVYDSNPEFGKYPLSVFRSALNPERHRVGLFMRDEGTFLHLPILSFCTCLFYQFLLVFPLILHMLQMTSRRTATTTARTTKTTKKTSSEAIPSRRPRREES